MQNSDNVIPFPAGGRDHHGEDPRAEATRAGSARHCYIVRLDLDHMRPPIWRRLRLASDLTLDRIHEIIQISMGWQDCHLHEFQMGPEARNFQMAPFQTPFDLSEGADGDEEFEDQVRLDQVIAEPGHCLFYTYDFGDHWSHTLTLEKVEPWVDGDPEAVCVTGRRACPPEDVGGLGGYAEVLDAMAGRVPPKDAEWMAEKLAWLPPGFDPERFDAAAVNEMLAVKPLPPLELWHREIGLLLANDQTRGAAGLPLLVQIALSGHDEADALTDEAAEAATARYRMFLRTVGTGVQLTAAGYLPPAVVALLCDGLEADRPWMRTGSRESRTPTILALRESATDLGLTRKAKGRLTVTRVGEQLADDPRGLLAHIASRVPLGRGFERIAGLLALLFAAAGKNMWESRLAASDIAFGLGWVTDADMPGAVTYSAAPTVAVLNQLCGRFAGPEQRARTARLLLRRAP